MLEPRDAPHYLIAEDGRPCVWIYPPSAYPELDVDGCPFDGCEGKAVIVLIEDLPAWRGCLDHAREAILEHAPTGIPTAEEVYCAAYDVMEKGVSKATPAPLGRFAIRQSSAPGRLTLAERGSGGIVVARVDEFRSSAALGDWIAKAISGVPHKWERYPDCPVDERPDELTEDDDEGEDPEGWGVY